jgi:hypothetical protein
MQVTKLQGSEFYQKLTLYDYKLAILKKFMSSLYKPLRLKFHLSIAI